MSQRLVLVVILLSCTRHALAQKIDEQVARPPKSAVSGPVFAVGGGGTPDVVLSKMLALAGGPSVAIVVLPQASASEDRGLASAQMFRNTGARHVDVVELDDRDAARSKIESARLIWFPGGSQSKLYDALDKAELVDLIRARHEAGVVFGGTSAGAAVMSDVMIPTSPAKPALRVGNTPIKRGLGLTPTLIVDQHFVERQRMTRLLSAVLDHPQQLGVGISERTAILVHKDTIQVLGDGSVVIIDPRSAGVAVPNAGQLQSARNLQIHVLKAGDQYKFDANK